MARSAAHSRVTLSKVEGAAGADGGREAVHPEVRGQVRSLQDLRA